MPEADPSTFDYRGDEDWRRPITAALKGVVDPEAALSIVDLGLVLSVEQTVDAVHVRLTMTSAACPVPDLIVDEVEQALDRVLPPEMQIRVQLCPEVEWTPERMSAGARRFMKW
jgi:metal-sulfur cluster biosynthetic enzyme